MTYRAIAVRRLLLAGAAAGTVAGCGAPDRYRPSFDRRVLPPSVVTRQQPARAPDTGVKQARADVPSVEPVPATPTPGEPAPQVADGRCAPGPLSLPDAIALAYRVQPRLRVFLEGVVQARGTERIALAPFLPTAVAGYSIGGFDLNAGGTQVQVGGLASRTSRSSRLRGRFRSG